MRGGIFVLDIGKSIKILDLAKLILGENENLKGNKIAINKTGLRPGKKLFKVLTNNLNLLGTIHPRINIAVETSTKSEQLQSF